MKPLWMGLLLLCSIAPAALSETNREPIAVDARGNLVTRLAIEAKGSELSPQDDATRRAAAVVVRRIGKVAVIHYHDHEQSADAPYRTATYMKIGGRWTRVASH